MTTVQVEVSRYDIDRSESDPSQCPITRAISKRFRISPLDVDVKGDSVYIWDEWDHPSEVYIFVSDAVWNFICSWEAMEVVEPFEFNMKKRRQSCLERH